MSERIISVAVKIEQMIFSLPPPARHHDVLHMMADNILKTEQGPKWEQGFLTCSGRFVSREAGVVIARFAGQLNIIRPKTSPEWQLFSEDLW